MRAAASFFLGSFLLHAALSLAILGLPPVAQTPLTTARFLVGWFVVAMAITLFGAMAFRPAWPKRRLLPAVAAAIWIVVAGGFPLAFVLPGSASVILAVGETLLAAGLLAAHRRGRHRPPPLPRRFAGKNFAAMAALALLATPLVVAAGLVNAAGTQIEAVTGGYVKLRPAGLLIEERRFERDGRTVRLVGMMHVGDREYYRGVKESLAADGPTVVLFEGVTDEHGLLRKAFSYARVAKLLGLTAQEASTLQREPPREPAEPGEEKTVPEKPAVEFRHADVDVSAFDPLTIEFLNAMASLLDSETLAEALALLGDPASPFNDPRLEMAVRSDVEDRRNAWLVEKIEAALPEASTVIVPWGALHLPHVEAELRRTRFRETKRLSRAAIPFWPARNEDLQGASPSRGP